MKQIHLNYFFVNGEKYFFKIPLRLDIKPLDENAYKYKNFFRHTYWECRSEDENNIIDVFSPTQKLLKRDVYEYMSFLYEVYALTEDSELTKGAKKIKDYILENTYKEIK